MTTTLNKVLVAAAFTSLMVIACDRPQGVKTEGEQSAEIAEHGNTRCALVDGQVFCASSRMREPIQTYSFAAL
jgi:hypothetical protein